MGAPKNAKELLETGKLEGHKVKYMDKSGKVLLTGTISSTFVVCDCNNCEGKKKVTLSQFEKDAGSRAKNAKSRIYVENGKNLHQVMEAGWKAEKMGGDFSEALSKAVESELSQGVQASSVEDVDPFSSYPGWESMSVSPGKEGIVKKGLELEIKQTDELSSKISKMQEPQSRSLWNLHVKHMVKMLSTMADIRNLTLQVSSSSGQGGHIHASPLRNDSISSGGMNISSAESCHQEPKAGIALGKRGAPSEGHARDAKRTSMRTCVNNFGQPKPRSNTMNLEDNHKLKDNGIGETTEGAASEEEDVDIDDDLPPATPNPCIVDKDPTCSRSSSRSMSDYDSGSSTSSSTSRSSYTSGGESFSSESGADDDLPPATPNPC